MSLHTDGIYSRCRECETHYISSADYTGKKTLAPFQLKRKYGIIHLVFFHTKLDKTGDLHVKQIRLNSVKCSMLDLKQKAQSI